jgi:TetR/AcrR family transcriptional regulator, transcriptional repressor for nem operon
LESASRHFRERGFDAPSVSEIMVDAGLTHGAFYGHFRSKADLAVSACRIAFEERLVAWTGDISLSSYLDRYISAEHRDNRGKGCPMPAFASGIDKQDKALQKQYARGVVDYVERIAGRLAEDGLSRPRAKKHAIGIVAAMVGGIVMARATVSNRQLSADVLASARSSIAARFSA